MKKRILSILDKHYLIKYGSLQNLRNRNNLKNIEKVNCNCNEKFSMKFMYVLKHNV